MKASMNLSEEVTKVLKKLHAEKRVRVAKDRESDAPRPPSKRSRLNNIEKLLRILWDGQWHASADLIPVTHRFGAVVFDARGGHAGGGAFIQARRMAPGPNFGAGFKWEYRLVKSRRWPLNKPPEVAQQVQNAVRVAMSTNEVAENLINPAYKSYLKGLVEALKRGEVRFNGDTKLFKTAWSSSS